MSAKPYTKNGIVGDDVKAIEEDESLQKSLNDYEDTTFDSLIKQVQFEYALCYMHQNGRIQKNLDRLKLFNNQKRDADLVGDPLLFGIHQTLLASLYNDRLSVAFDGREEGDSDTSDNLNNLALFDYKIMKKEVLDYNWDFDALFFGRGLIGMDYFERREKFMCTLPYWINPGTFLRDPNALSVNGDVQGIGAMRFGGREIAMSKQEMKNNGNYINLGDLKKGVNVRSLVEQFTAARDDAGGMDKIFGKDIPSFGASGNFDFYLLEWKTHWKGKKVEVTLGNNMKLITRYRELGKATDEWKIVDRPLYPNSYSWDGVSLPDLVEDKQRQRSVALNLGLNMLKADLYPSYAYNEKQVKNPQDLANLMEFNKFVPLNGDGDSRTAISPINKASPNGALLDWIMNTLDTSAQRATSTPDIQQGVQSEKDRPLGETNILASRVDTRYSLAAKIFGWSEENFWGNWYLGYKENLESSIDEKVIRINGAFGSKWRPLTKDQIVTKIDPDISIESAVIAEAKNQRERLLFIQFGNLVLQDPTVNRRYFERKMAKLNGMTKDEIDRLLPPTIDEIIAEEENDIINQDKVPPINANDNHIVHWEIHSKAKETTAKMAHMEAHKRGMLMKRDQPEIFPAQSQVDTNPQQTGSKTTPTESQATSQGFNVLR